MSETKTRIAKRKCNNDKVIYCLCTKCPIDDCKDSCKGKNRQSICLGDPTVGCRKLFGEITKCQKLVEFWRRVAETMQLRSGMSLRNAKELCAEELGVRVEEMG